MVQIMVEIAQEGQIIQLKEILTVQKPSATESTQLGNIDLHLYHFSMKGPKAALCLINLSPLILSSFYCFLNHAPLTCCDLGKLLKRALVPKAAFNSTATDL